MILFPNSNYYLDNEILKHCNKNWYPPSNGAINECVDECPDEFPFFLNTTNKCVDKCPEGLYIYKNGCYVICPSGSTNIGRTCIEDKLLLTPVDSYVESEQPVDVLFGKIEKNILEYAESVKGNIKGDGYYMQVYPIGNDIDDCNDISTIDIGECEGILKKTYELPSNESLLILKVDKECPESLINKVEYKVYSHEAG